MLSARAEALEQQIREQDQLLLRATACGARMVFVAAAIAWRNELVRQLTAEWRKAS